MEKQNFLHGPVQIEDIIADVKHMFLLNKKTSRIVERMTSNPFCVDKKLWLYWLFKLELIPGSWCAVFYLEENYKKPDYKFLGLGSPNKAVLEAYKKIDKKWLAEGFKEGKKQEKIFTDRQKKIHLK